MDTPSARFSAISVLLWLSFLSACLFYGVGENLLLLFVSCGFLLGAFALTPLCCWRRLYAEQTLAVGVCVYVLGVLTVAYQTITISPDNSFAMTWALAAIPIWYLVCAANPERRRLLLALVATVGVFALHSAVQFLLSGQPAYEPLSDPNHYASLMYLVWIPLAHYVLINDAWHKLPGRIPVAVLHMVLFMLVLVIAVTGSRVGMAVIGAALLGWLLLVLMRRLSAVSWLLLLFNTTAAFVVWWFVSPAGLPTTVDSADFQTGMTIRSALNAAAFQMFLEAPLTGSGIFTFPLLYPLFRLPGDQSTAGMFVHNDYLQLLLESGPWLVAALVVLIVAIVRRLWFGLTTGRGLENFGLAMAAAALLAHASVNFVLYFLPLGIVLAVICGELYPARWKLPAESNQASADVQVSDSAKSGSSLRIAWAASLLLVFSSWCYLGLDVVTQGVFGGQAAPGFIGQLRRDVPTMLSFSGTARRLNDERVTPILAEAMLLSLLLENNSEYGVSKQSILERYRLALAMDPYNSAAYQQFCDFIEKSADAELIASLRPEETPDALLLKVVQLELGRTPSVFQLLSIYDRLGQSEKGLRMLKLFVYPWLERIQWSQPKNTEVMMSEMARRAEAAGDDQFLMQLEARAREIDHIRPIKRVQRLKQWQQELLR